MDCTENEAHIGYQSLLNKHISKYERIFEENETKFNRYKPIDEAITVTENDDQKRRNSDDVVEQSEQSKVQEIQRQTTSHEKNKRNIDTNLYKVFIDSDKQQTHTYTCEWCTCGYDTNDYKSLEHHVIGEHIATRIYRHYSRSFMELNVHQYRCLRCDYDTKTVDNILKHVNDDHNQHKCLVTMCGQSFASKDELSFHESAQHYSRAYEPNSGRIKRWKCFLRKCSKTFLTRDECVLHEKQHLCVFNLKDSEYLNGKGRCSLSNIRKYYQKRRVIDGSARHIEEYRYLCLWSQCSYETSKCGYETYNYNAIQEHIHNSHTCPLINDELVLEHMPTNIVINELISDV